MIFVLFLIRETTLLIQNNLKTLCNLTEIGLYSAKTTLNASFILSFVKYVSISNLINQKSIVNSNITYLRILDSESPLKNTPINIQLIIIVDTLQTHFDLSNLPSRLDTLELKDKKYGIST